MPFCFTRWLRTEKTSPTRPALSVSQLEDRTTPTATASFVGGVLTITGDSADDTIRVQELSPGTVRAGQAANPASYDLGTFVGVTSVVIDAGEGNNQVDTPNLSFGVSITTGSGNDRVRPGKAADVISTGAGDDTIEGASTLLLGDSINAGAGFDTVSNGGDTNGETRLDGVAFAQGVERLLSLRTTGDGGARATAADNTFDLSGVTIDNIGMVRLLIGNDTLVSPTVPTANTESVVWFDGDGFGTTDPKGTGDVLKIALTPAQFAALTAGQKASLLTLVGSVNSTSFQGGTTKTVDPATYGVGGTFRFSNFDSAAVVIVVDGTTYDVTDLLDDPLAGVLWDKNGDNVIDRTTSIGGVRDGSEDRSQLIIATGGDPSKGYAIFAASGNDIVIGSSKDDFIVLGGGDDVVFAADGNDSVTKFNGSSGDEDLIFMGNGNDYFGGLKFTFNSVNYDFGNTVLRGPQTIFGEAGDDILVGGAGVDTLVGGGGNDKLFKGDVDLFGYADFASLFGDNDTNNDGFEDSDTLIG